MRHGQGAQTEDHDGDRSRRFIAPMLSLGASLRSTERGSGSFDAVAHDVATAAQKLSHCIESR